jgi:hypothetical protein
MKKIVLMLSFILLLVNCSSKIKIYLDEEEGEISKKGIDIWNQDIKYVDFVMGDVFFQPDVHIIKRSWRNWNILGECKWDGESEKPKPVLIIIYTNHDVVIAHEFGHFLGYKDNTNNSNSIMYSSYDNLDRGLNQFDEFKDE